jgi:hypothetical protein
MLSLAANLWGQMPFAMDAEAGRALAGRAGELAELEAALDRLAAGQRSFVQIVGEPYFSNLSRLHLAAALSAAGDVAGARVDLSACRQVRISGCWTFVAGTDGSCWSARSWRSGSSTQQPCPPRRREKTVESHLARIYDKLGVRSRAALAALLGEDAEESGRARVSD